MPKKQTLEELVDKITPKSGRAIPQILRTRSYAKALLWLELQLGKFKIVYTHDLGQFLICSYQNAYYILTTFENCGLVYRVKEESRGAFKPTLDGEGKMVLTNYLKYAVKTLDCGDYEGS
jgi:hypothetical protein